MLKYVDICVDMKAGRKCKDALINYRNACQQVRCPGLHVLILVGRGWSLCSAVSTYAARGYRQQLCSARASECAP